MKIIYVTLLLFLISFSTPRMSSKNKLHRKHQSSTKLENLSDIFTLLVDTFRQPINYWNFTLGLLSQFFPIIVKYIRELQKYGEAFVSCFSNFNSNPVSSVASTIQFSDYEREMATPEKRMAYCENNKKIIFNIYHNKKAELSTPTPVDLCLLILNPGLALSIKAIQDSMPLFENAYRPAFSYCREIVTGSPNPQTPCTNQMIERYYKTYENFYEQCLFFKDLDCATYTPESAGFTVFARSAYGFYESLQAVGTCIKTEVAKLAPNTLKEILLDIFKSSDFYKTALASVANIAVNVITAGAWGAIKAAYYLIKLGIKIGKFALNPEKDTAYQIGTIVGNSALIVKSLLMTKRKRKFLRRRK